MNKCKKCKFYIHTITLESLDKPVWHCRYGFTPTKDCKRMGEYNDEIVNNGFIGVYALAKKNNKVKK